MRPSLAAYAVGMLVLLHSQCVADEKQDAAQLDQLIHKIELLLPKDWQVDFRVSNDRWRRDAPLIVVRSKDHLPIEYIAAIGRPAAGSEEVPYIVQDVVELEFELMPFVTPKEFAAIKKRNHELEQRRRSYELTRLGQRQEQYKGGFTPSSYARQTKDGSPIVREYALLWLNTKPQPLPTHHFANIAVLTRDLPPALYSGVTIKIHNGAKHRQYEDILSALGRLFTPYETATE